MWVIARVNRSAASVPNLLVKKTVFLDHPRWCQTAKVLSGQTVKVSQSQILAIDPNYKEILREPRTKKDLKDKEGDH